MGTVIFSAGPLQTFLTSLGTILFFFVLGGISLGRALTGGQQGRGARLGLGLAGTVLLAAGVAMAFATIQTITSGDRTVAALLDDKVKARDSCGDGDTCLRFVLEMRAGGTSYDFSVPESAFERAEIGSCYQVTYYPNKGLFSEPAQAESYVATSNVTRIEQVDPGACR